MTDLIQSFAADYGSYLKILAWSSPLLFIIGIAATPFLAALIPDDYFNRKTRPKKKRDFFGTLVHLTGIFLKNAAGLCLIVAGLAMLVLPGQGILTLVLGILLIDYPGKFSLERKLISMPSVLKSVNWARKKRGKTEIELRDITTD